MEAYRLFYDLYNNNLTFKNLIDKSRNEGKIRDFGDDEWNKIKSQNYDPPTPELKEFIDLFIFGYNIGNCVNTSIQLSYSYNDVDIVSGILPILKGTLNAEKVGGHCWLETSNFIIDTSLMLVIDKSLKSDFGYQEEQRITAHQLRLSTNYQTRKEFTNDRFLKK